MKNGYRLLSLTLLLLAGISARAETLDCTAITSLPYGIATQGVYCLTGNLSTSMTSGNAITINANNVTIDLNGFKLGGLGAGDGTQARGIYALQRKNITIKNGIIRGFYYGIRLDGGPAPFTTTSGHVIKDILADQNTRQGIFVQGLGSTVSHNKVVDTGGSVHFDEAYGIVVMGPGVKVLNNKVSKTTAQGAGSARGIYLESADYGLVQNNTVTDTLKSTGSSYAVYIARSTGVFVRNNNLANADIGLFFSPVTIVSSGKYFNNLTFDVTAPFTGGTPVGNNNN